MENCASPITREAVSFLVEQRDERVAGFLRLMIPVAVTLAAFLSVIGVPPAFAQVDVEDWPGTVEVRVTGKTQGLTTGDVFTYQLRLTEPPTEERWWVRIRADGVVYMEGIYNGLRWVPSIGWEFSPQNYNQWRDVRVRVNEDLDQTVTFSHEVWAHNGICPVHDVARVAVDVSGDAPPPPEEDLPRLSIADAATVTEGGEAVFTVRLSDTSSETVTVRYATVDDTAVAGSDYTRTTGTLRFDPNERTDTIRVPILQDSTAEPSESFTVELSNPNRATVSDGTGAVTIEADPMPELRISDAAPVAEGNDAVFTVSLSTPSSQVVTVEYTTEDGTADAGDDYTTIAETLTFSPGQTTKIIRVPVLVDSTQESSETFTVELSTPMGTTLADSIGLGTITADPMPGLSIGDAEPVAEGGAAVFTVTLVPASNHVVTVTYSTVDGTAVADADFTSTSGTLTFNPNQTTKTIRVPILRDTVHEPSETFTVELDDPTGTTLADSTGLGTIAADATPGLSIADAVNVAEGRDAVFRVTLRPATNHVVSVTYTTMDGTAVADADYTPVTGTLRFEPRETTKTIRVPVLLDTMTEQSETFTVELSNPGGSTLADPIGVGTIRADPAPSLRIGDATPVAEGDEAVFTVTLTPPNEQVVTVDYTTTDGTAVADEDYSATSGTLRFAPGDTSKTIRVPTLRDAVAEPVETFTVVLSNPSGTNVVHDTGVGTITDEGLPGLSIADAPTVAEGGEAVFPVTLNPASSQVVTVAYATQDGTAVADSDYTATSGTLRFEPGETIQNIQVATLRDAIAEPSESFTVELSDPVGTAITNSTGAGTIAADAMPALSITDAVPVAEGGEATFMVSLSALVGDGGRADSDSDTRDIGNAALRAGRDDTEHPGGDASRRHRRAERELHSGAE